jgi:hypothetical protein
MRGRKPSPAMVVAIIALVFSVAGTGVASVAVIRSLSKKEKKQTSRIADREVKKLAPTLTVGTAKALTPPEDFHNIGTQGNPLFESGCTNLPGQDPLGYFKDHDGVVHLRGGWGTCAPSAVVFHLPPGYRVAPGTEKVFALAGNSSGAKLVLVGAGIAPGYDGAVYCETGNCVVDGVTYVPGA